MAVILALAAGAASAMDGDDLLARECSSCHNLTGPSPTSLQQLWQRKGPDLFYAGNKYKADWMERWLQQPTRIRPAGMFYADHVKSGPEGDEIDTATLTQHPALSAADAKTVTANLMQRKAKAELITAGAYTPATISRSSGEMLFDKFKGCLACHEIEPGYGGLSGPEVYTAARRLQDDYLVSYLRNPQAWDPKIFMPNKHLNETDAQKFTAYFHLLSEEGAQ
jgi:cbb3-type cytochrome oxidase cytochrome c subunit